MAFTADRWSRVKELFAEALARLPAERPQLLDATCFGDTELRHEVEALLVAHDAAGDMFEHGTPAVSALARVGIPLSHGVFHLAVGRRIGPYEIIEAISAGGMGQVYRARDTRLHRDVALKVLPPALVADPARCERFVQEARAASALEHPHIAVIHEIGEADGVSFIAMELVRGEPLGDAIARGPLTPARALDLAIEIAEGLARAHETSIVHRDLKPGNVMLTEDGHAKIIDFGLAKLIDALSPDSNGVRRTVHITESDVVLGTVSYMSPEQARGTRVDHRSDIFSFGILLYEMLTGYPPFRGTRIDTMHAIVHDPAPALPSSIGLVTDDLQRVLEKCLAKEAGDRYEGMRPLVVDLRATRRRLESSQMSAVNATGRGQRDRPRSSAPRWPGFAAALAVLAILSIAIAFRSPGAVSSPGQWVRLMKWPDLVSRRTQDDRAFQIPPVNVVRLTALAGEVTGPTLSPDGNLIAFGWSGDNERGCDGACIYVMHTGGGKPLRLGSAGLEGWPVWSPDGSRIAFIRQMSGRTGIFTVPILGGPERKLVGLRDDRYFGLAWSPDGKYLAFAERTAFGQPYSLFLLSLETLERRQLTWPSPPAFGELRFAFSPDGKTLAFIHSASDSQVFLLSLAEGETKPIFSHRDHIGGVAWTSDGQALVLSVSQDGVRRLAKLPITGGTLEPLPFAGDDAYYPAVSWNRNRLAFVRELDDADIWRVELQTPLGPGKASAPLIKTTRYEGDPQFSPDGKRIAFHSIRSGSHEIWLSDADGANQIQLTFFRGPGTWRPYWSPDGRQIVFFSNGIYVVSAGGGQPRRLDDGRGATEAPVWSADGRWVYFACGGPVCGDLFNIWKAPAGGGQSIQVTKNGGFRSQESPDGKYLFFTKMNDRGLWRLPVAGGDEFSVIKDFDPALAAYWQVVDDGIYFVDVSSSPYPTITFLSFATRQKTPLAMMAGPVCPWAGGLTVSPDRHFVVYTQKTYESSEIFLADNFH